MRSPRPLAINAALGLVIVAALAGGALLLLPNDDASAEEATQLTSTVQQGAVSSSISASGTISPKEELSEGFAVSGTISSVKVSLGDTVKKGQVIAKLDTSDFDDAVSDAYTTYYRALESLAEAEDAEQTSTSQINSAEDAVDDAYDAIQQAQDDLSETTLRASKAGLVTAVNVQRGDTVAASSGSSDTSGVVTIAVTSKYTVEAAITEADIADVATGQDATVSFPALDDEEVAARVTAIAPTATASNSTVTYATTITLREVPDGLRLGQTAEVSIVISASADDALYVPSAAISTADDGTSTVDVVDADTGETETVTVETGVVGDEGTEITSGLEAGETIVIGTVTADSGDSTDTGTTQQGTDMGGFTGEMPSGGGAPAGGMPGGNQ